MVGVSDLYTGIQNVVKAINGLNQTLSTVFPQAGSTSTTATSGPYTLPGDVLGFLNVTLPDGTPIRIPYYDV